MFCSVFFWKFCYQLGCTVAAVSSNRPVEHVNNAVQNIATEWTPHSVVSCSAPTCFLSLSAASVSNVTDLTRSARSRVASQNIRCPASSDRSYYDSNVSVTHPPLLWWFVNKSLPSLSGNESNLRLILGCDPAGFKLWEELLITRHNYILNMKFTMSIGWILLGHHVIILEHL